MDRTEPPSGVPMLAQNNLVNFGKVLDGLDGSSLGSPDKSPIIPTQTAVGSLSRCLLTNHRTTIFLSFKSQRQMDHQEDLETQLRQHALERITIYTHPDIVLKHEPINAKECEQLQAELRERIREKIEKVRREYQAQDFNNNYQQVYSEFIKMTNTNEAQQQAMCRDLQEMHEIADVLMNPPPFGKDLFLSSKQPPNAMQQTELKGIYDYYQKLYKSGSTKEENEADQAIKRAKEFILKQ